MFSANHVSPKIKLATSWLSIKVYAWVAQSFWDPLAGDVGGSSSTFFCVTLGKFYNFS